jgi:penicillin-binding protein 1A
MRPLKILLVFLAVCLASGGLTTILRGISLLDSLQDYNPNLVTKVWSHDGQLIGEFCIERRIVVPLRRCPSTS